MIVSAHSENIRLYPSLESAITVNDPKYLGFSIKSYILKY